LNSELPQGCMIRSGRSEIPQPSHILAHPPLPTPTSAALQLLLRVHQPLLHPGSVLAIASDILAVQQIRQRDLDVQVDVPELVLVGLDLGEVQFIEGGWEGAATGRWIKRVDEVIVVEVVAAAAAAACGCRGDGHVS